jgi:hypothetical protein
MAQLTTLGSMPKKMPKGFFKAVEFPSLTQLDQTTSDHRRLLSEGAGARTLPQSIKYASKTSAMGGHDGAEVSGALFEVTIDPLNGKMSGKGFLLDDEHGRRHARLAYTGAMTGNSVDLNDVKAKFVEDFETGEYWIEFTEFKVGGTTGVSNPAFAESSMQVVDEMSDDELVASLTVAESPMTPLVMQTPDEYFINIVGVPEVEELTASMATLVAFDDFYRPEADRPTKIVVDADNRVYGHLSLWDTCHDGFSDKCLITPRPTDGYASFNQAGPLTERGQVETGPIFALGGHRKAKSAPTIEQAYGGIENAWADVRIIEGRFGPWISGVVRPGVDDDMVYAARASRISGHWVNGRLKAIVSVNVGGYEVPGSGEFSVDFSTGFAYATNDEGVAELVASFPGCAEIGAADLPTNQLTLSFSSSVDTLVVANAVATAFTANGDFWTVVPDSTSGGTPSTYQIVPNATTYATGPVTPLAKEHANDDDFEEVTPDQEWADGQLAALLEDERDADEL